MLAIAIWGGAILTGALCVAILIGPTFGAGAHLLADAPVILIVGAMVIFEVFDASKPPSLLG